LGPGKNRSSISLLVVFILTCLGSCGADPLIHSGRHFGRTVHALCTVSALINNGILRMGELAERPNETFTHEYVILLSSSKWLSFDSLHEGAPGAPNISDSSWHGTGAWRPSDGGLGRQCHPHIWACMYLSDLILAFVMHSECLARSKRVPPVQDPTTPRA
jgi:hypothetical protein